jgi:hypothetical protein
VIFESKADGRPAKVVIDATGDGDILRWPAHSSPPISLKKTSPHDERRF